MLCDVASCMHEVEETTGDSVAGGSVGLTQVAPVAWIIPTPIFFLCKVLGGSQVGDDDAEVEL